MMKIGSSFVRAAVLMFTVVVLCGTTLPESKAHAKPTGILSHWDAGAWEKYAAYLISRQLCSRSTNGDGDERWPKHLCASVRADLTLQSSARLSRVHLSHGFDHLYEAGAFTPTEFSFESGVSPIEASFNASKSYAYTGSATAGDAEPVAAGLPVNHEFSTSLRHNAIPGSLLVTILALVGIVAVARRDVISQHIARPAAGSGVKVKRIASSRHNADIAASHIH